MSLWMCGLKIWMSGESCVYKSEKRTTLNSWLVPVICLLLCLSGLVCYSFEIGRSLFLLEALLTCPVWHVREHLACNNARWRKVYFICGKSSCFTTPTPGWTFPFQKWDQGYAHFSNGWPISMWIQNRQEWKSFCTVSQEGNKWTYYLYHPFLFASCWLFYYA